MHLESKGYSMISINDKKECCGCSACANICPINCIDMIEDKEGFLYPNVDEEKCVNCHMCENVCPLQNKKLDTFENRNTYGYIFQNKNSKDLKESTSGGFFSALAREVLENNGVVFGAAFDGDFHVRHKYIECIEDLNIFRNSKYIQSDIGESFKQCKEFLDRERLVCFSGTPCQIAALISYLDKNYENLITVDVVCRGVPSPLLLKKYIDLLGGKENIKNLRFRDKRYGYYSSTFSVNYKNNIIKRTDIRSNPLLHFFFDDICSRPSCYKCAFKTIDRVSDFTMFDCWHAIKHSDKFGSKGATAVIARGIKAENIIKKLEKYNICLKSEVSTLVKDDGFMMVNSVKMNSKRQEFFDDFINKGFDYVVKKYHVNSNATKIKCFVKSVLVKCGIFNKMMIRKMKNN